MDAEKVADALTEFVTEAVQNALDEIDIPDKVTDAIDDLDLADIVAERVDFTDLIKDNADFDTAAKDAIEENIGEVVRSHLQSMDWAYVVEQYANIRETLLASVDLSELASEAVSKRVQQEWEHNQKVTDSYVLNKLDAGLNDQISEMVEDRLTSQFHDIDRDLDERVCQAVGPLIDRIKELEARLAKPWWRRIFG